MEKKIRNRVILGVVSGIAALTVAGTLLSANHFRNYEYVFPNVTCEGQSLEGMTHDQAEKAVAGIIAAKRYQVTVNLPETEPWVVDPEQIVTEQQPGAALQEIWNYGREDNSFFGPLRAYLAAKKAPKEVVVSYVLEYDPATVKTSVEALKDEITIDPTPCQGTVDEQTHTAQVIPGEKGRTIDAEAVEKQVCDALDGRRDAVDAEYAEIPLDESQLEELLSALAEDGYVEVVEPSVTYDEERETSMLYMGTPGFALDTDQAEGRVYAASDAGESSVSIPLNETDPERYDLRGFHDWVKRDPEGVYYYQGALYGGTPGYDFDLSSAEAAEEQAGFGDTVEIPLDVTQPVVPIDYARQVLFRDQLGRADTYHTGAYARTNNLILSCEAIDGTILNPGEEFSFNDVVGERTASKGYMSALVYLSTGNEAQLGGGICQTASTLYMAALKAGMEITERAEHMYTVSYCPLGLDATIYWGYSDLRFVNTRYMPVRINASVSDGQVHMSITGTNFTGRYIELSSERVSSSPIGYRAYRTTYNADGTEYYTEDLGVSYYSTH